MFRSTTIFWELQYPCQSQCYLNTVVCIPSAVVWQHMLLFVSVYAPQAQTDTNNMICCHTTALGIHTTVFK